MITTRGTPWLRQPPGIPRIDWQHPLSEGLEFLAWPLVDLNNPNEATFVDLVTGVVGTRTGTITGGYRGRAGGKSALNTNGFAVAGAAGLNDYVSWPVSSARGGSIVQSGTILALAGTVEQVDGKQYCVGGNTEAVTIGDGFALGVDSFQFASRGGILRARYAGVAGDYASVLGNPFDNRTHCFGYSFANNGATGTWLYDRTGTTWSGGNTFGTTTTNRQAYVNAYSSADSPVAYGGCYVLLLGIWRPEWSVKKYQAWYDNPWQNLLPARRTLYVASSTPGVPTLSAATAVSITSTTATPQVTLTF